MEEKVKKTEPQQNNNLTDNLTKNLTDFKVSILTPKLIIALVLVIILGIGTGYIFGNKGSSKDVGLGTLEKSKSEEGVVGSSDTKTFKDTAEGTMELGGIEGEGAYHLVRPGGKSQYVYLTSSVVDLSTFVGKKVKVWGETQKAQYAGWLMDAGRVQVLE